MANQTIGFHLFVLLVAKSINVKSLIDQKAIVKSITGSGGSVANQTIGFHLFVLLDARLMNVKICTPQKVIATSITVSGMSVVDQTVGLQAVKLTAFFI